VFKIKPIPKHMNGNSDAVRIMDLIQLLPENDSYNRSWREKVATKA